jgi:hyperosmotically inducible periplasmic protein
MLKRKLLLGAVVTLMMAMTAAAAVNPSSPLAREIRHELVMLPYYSVFDNLEFKVDGGKVVLMGQVTRPTLKEDAARVVKRLEGVDEVENKIEVLPLSPMDDQIRMATFRAIYATPELNRYAHQAIPPIHIIVNNGRIVLEGAVANDFDRILAYDKALQVPGAFAVTNHLRIEP